MYVHVSQETNWWLRSPYHAISCLSWLIDEDEIYHALIIYKKKQDDDDLCLRDFPYPRFLVLIHCGSTSARLSCQSMLLFNYGHGPHGPVYIT